MAMPSDGQTALHLAAEQSEQSTFDCNLLEVKYYTLKYGTFKGC